MSISGFMEEFLGDEDEDIEEDEDAGTAQGIIAAERKVDALIRVLDIDPAQYESGVVPVGFSARIQELWNEGRKIEAIKLYREETGVGLREAKEAVEDIGDGGTRGMGSLHQKLDILLQHFGVVGAEPESEEPQEKQEDSLDDLIRTGRKIEAIKRYREETGVGLAQAKQAVDARERELLG